MERVLILGNGGAGKSTLSKKLSDVKGLPAIHLDNLFWLPDWEQRSEEEFDKILKEALKQDKWTMDGNYNRTLPARLVKADTVIFLDFNRFLCAWRAIKRVFEGGEQAKGCPQKVDWEFLKYILWDYTRKNRKKAYKLKENYPDKNWIILKSPGALNKFIEQLG